MSRTLDEIKQAIRADFVSNFTLQEAYGLDGSKTFDEQFSKVSVEALLTFVVASAIYLLELIITKKTEDLTTLIGSEYPFSIPWYYSRAKMFQLGDNLLFDESTYRFSYQLVDETKQIIKNVAIRQREMVGVTKLQVYATKQDKSALTADEFAAFQAYIKLIGAAGTHFDFVSLAPDVLTINLTINYDPQLVSYSGDRLAGGGKPVNEAIESYLENIKYSGSLSRTKLVDAVQAAEGVFDVILGDILMNGDLNNAQKFESPSGFFKATVITVTYTPGYEY